MITKVRAAQLAASSGIPALITCADNARAALAGEDVGTWFFATGTRKSVHDLWLGYLADICGTIVLDDGAVAAVRRRRSLLAAGITGVQGRFESSEPVELVNQEGAVIAHGLSSYSFLEIAEMMGLPSGKITEKLGEEYDGTVVHADHLVLVNTR